MYEQFRLAGCRKNVSEVTYFVTSARRKALTHPINQSINHNRWKPCTQLHNNKQFLSV